MPKLIYDQDVFQGVMQVIIERGYDGATTRRMAAAAKVSEVTLFRRYGSKAELVRRAITYIAERMDFEAAIHYTGDVARDLLHLVTRYREMTAEYGEFLAVMIPEVHRHPELAGAMQRPLRVMGAIGELLARYQEGGVLRPEPPLHAVAALLGPLVYFAMAQGTLFVESLPPVDLKAHVTGFLEGRRSGPPR